MYNTLYVPLLLKIKKAVKTAADTFRSNPDFKVDEAITELGVGEALISCLDEQGTPQIVERGWVMPPYSSFTPITPEERQTLNFAKYYCRGL
ncbi:helicase HerA-like domain-containing protein [Acinetobacter baumannii]